MPAESMIRAALIISMLIGTLSGVANAADFPGKGSRLLWGYALQNYSQANHYVKQERYEEAIDQYNQAIERYPYDPDFYINLGVAYTKLGDFANAEKTLKAATQLNKNDWMPWSNLANVYAKQDKLKEALPIFEMALKCKPPQAEIDPIKSNIAGIKRILNAQAKFQPAPNKPTVNAKATANSKITAGSKATTSTAKTDRECLKKSGWDWSY